MQFKIDENLPVEISKILLNAGHDAKTVNDQQLKGTKDKVLIDVCKKENRALITAEEKLNWLEDANSFVAAAVPEEKLKRWEKFIGRN